MREGLLILAVAALLAGPHMHEQDRRRIPARPELPEAADTNDARAYYVHGLELLGADEADEAANAFYWASRLDPNRAEFLHGLRSALLISDKGRLLEYWDENEAVLTSPEISYIDSLATRALMRDPFYYRLMDPLVATHWIDEKFRREIYDQFGTRIPDWRLQQAIDSLILADTSASTQAWLAYAKREFNDALRHLARLLEQAPNDTTAQTDVAWVRFQRAQIFFQQRRWDSAAASLEDALEELHARDASRLVAWYQSKALFEYALGYVYETRGLDRLAEEAYARALLEDLSFYPAHIRLGSIALERGDTANALGEFVLASESDPTEALPLILLGQALYQTGRLEEASAKLAAAIGIEPYHAELYYFRALVLEAMGDRSTAAASYRVFAARCKRSDKRLPLALRKVEELEGG